MTDYDKLPEGFRGMRGAELMTELQRLRKVQSVWHTDNTTPIKTLLENVPKWIESDVTPYDVAGIYQSGRDLGAYMPAVPYYKCAEIMAEHGDDVLIYLENRLGEIPSPPKDPLWSTMAVSYLTSAFYLWAHEAVGELNDIYDAAEEQSK